MTVIPVRRKDIVGDTDRAALAAAIAAERSAKALRDNGRLAISRAQQLLEAAEERLATAGTAVAEAREQDAAEAAKAIRTSAAAAPGTVRKVRQAQAEAEDAVEIARLAAARLAADVADQETAYLWRRNDVIVAVAAVVGPAAERLLAEAAELKLRLAVNLAVVGELITANEAEKSGLEFTDELRAKAQRDAPFAGLRERLERLGASGGVDLAGENIAATLAAWHQAANIALREDAAAQLPLPHFGEAHR